MRRDRITAGVGAAVGVMALSALARGEALGEWPLGGTFEPPRQTAQFRSQEEWRVGDGTTKAAFAGTLIAAPLFRLGSGESLEVDLGGDRLRVEQGERQDPADPHGVPWRREVEALAMPYQQVSRVRVVFDRGTADAAASHEPVRRVPIPSGAQRVRRLEVEWIWRDQRRTFGFGQSEGREEPGLALALILSVVGCAFATVRREGRAR